MSSSQIVSTPDPPIMSGLGVHMTRNPIASFFASANGPSKITTATTGQLFTIPSGIHQQVMTRDEGISMQFATALMDMRSLYDLTMLARLFHLTTRNY